VRLLVVDFDYFFPNPMGNFADKHWGLYDWGHVESDFFINAVWDSRAIGFSMNDLELPDTSGLETKFWDHFKFSPGAKLYVAESNAKAVMPQVAEGVTSVWLYDAHHDSRYKSEPEGMTLQDINMLLRKGVWHCEDWMIFYVGQTEADLHVRYPEWKHWAFDAEPYSGLEYFNLDRRIDNAADNTLEFDRVFICKSGAWVPPWLDPKFRAFVSDCPVGPRECLEPPPWSSVRKWDPDEHRKTVTILKKMKAGATPEELAALVAGEGLP
jgi:hypothetical protein